MSDDTLNSSVNIDSNAGSSASVDEDDIANNYYKSNDDADTNDNATITTADDNKNPHLRKTILKIAILACSFIVLLIILKLASPDIKKDFEKRRNEKSNTAQLASVQPAANNQNNNLPALPAATNNPQIQVNPNDQQNSKDIASLKNGLQSITDKQAALENDIDAINNSLQDIKQSIAETNGAVSRLNDAILNVPQNVISAIKANELKKKEAEQMKIDEALAKKKALSVIKTREHYYLRAAIQGRAWIIDGDGKTLSVALGDKIPGVGNVESIDPINGTIMTTDGVEITFPSS